MASDILSGFQTRLHHLYHGGTRDGIIAARETNRGGGLCHGLEVYIMVADIIMEWKARKDS